MILLKVILENFRTHEYFEFVPTTEGTTAISGENGAGKSTIVDAFSWSLFGTRLHGLKNKNYIREGVDPKTQTVRVTSFIIEGNREYKIERIIVNPAGGSSCNVYSREINSEDEFTLECGPGISHSETYIKKLLNCDEKGFLSSVFIQQKQVDQIVSAGPRERGAVIEQLIGVSSISEAIYQAKEESKGYQKALQVMQPGSVKDEEERVAKQKELVISMMSNQKKLIEEIKSIAIELVPLTELFEEEKIKQEEASTHEAKLLLKENDLKNVNEAIKQNLDFLNEETEVNFSEDFLKELQEELNGINLEQQTHSNNLISISSQLNYFSDLFKRPVKPETLEMKKKIDIESKNIADEISNLKLRIKELESNIEFNQIFLEELSEGKANCSVCGHIIEDPETEKIKHENLLKEETLELKNSKKLLKDKELQSNKLLDNSLKINRAVELLEQQQKSQSDYDKLLLEKESISSKISSLNIAKEKLEEKIRELLSKKEKAETIVKIKVNLKNSQDKAKVLKSEIDIIKNNLISIGAVSKTEFNKISNDYNKLSSLKEEKEKEGLRLKGQIDLEVQKGKEFKARLENCIESMKKHEELSKQLGIHNEVLKALTEFKEARIKESIPELTSIASEILGKFTGGDFIELKLTENFETSVVTSSGKERPVAQLSGGELSAAAIALRLAISLFLHKGSQSLLILDEVLVSMSEERSQLILETITSLTQSQIIFIAHSTTINNFADKIIEI